MESDHSGFAQGTAYSLWVVLTFQEYLGGLYLVQIDLIGQLEDVL